MNIKVLGIIIGFVGCFLVGWNAKNMWAALGAGLIALGTTLLFVELQFPFMTPSMQKLKLPSFRKVSLQMKNKLKSRMVKSGYYNFYWGKKNITGLWMVQTNRKEIERRPH